MKVKFKGIYIAIFYLLLLNSNTDAKGGRGSSGGSRGSSSRGSSSRGSSSSGGGWFGSSSRSSPSYSSPSYSRPSPSYTYSAPSPSYTYSRPAPSPSYTYSAPSPSYTHNSPSSSYGWNTGSNTGGSSFGSASKPSPSTSYGWNVGGSNTGSTNIGSKPASTSYGWNVGSNTGNTGSTNTGSKPGTIGWNVNSAPSAPVGPPPSYPGLQNRPAASHNNPPAYSPSYNNPPAYSPSHFNSPSYRPSPSYSPSPSYRPSPSYSPSYNSPSYNSRPSPSYTSGSNIPRQNVYTYSSSPNSHQNYYGNTFGSHGVPSNTYISNNYYGNQRSGGSGFLTNAMFYGAGMHSGYGWGRSSGYNSYGHHYGGYGNNYGYGDNYGYNRRRWDEDDDRRWRQTTRAPYFENKVPGEDKILPASAVIGAATAFGLASLLPLNVPSNKPLMYCNSTEVMQSLIMINNEFVYQCINRSIAVSCFKNSNDNVTQEVPINQPLFSVNQTEVLLNQTLVNVNQTEIIANQTESLKNTTELQANSTEVLENSTEAPVNQTEIPINQTEALKNQSDHKCTSRIMQCDLPDYATGNVYCKKDTLLSKDLMFCNSTTLLNGTIIINGTSINTTTTILNCYHGQVAEKRASFIPTTTKAPETTTEKSLSFGAKAHLFFLRIIGKGDIADQKPTLTPIAEDIPQLSDNETWIPEALTIPPETTTLAPTTTTEGPYEWMMIVNKEHPNGTFEKVHQPVPEFLLNATLQMNSLLTALGSTTSISPKWFKLYKTTEAPTTVSTSTTETPFDWMMEVPTQFENGTFGTKLELVPKDLIESQDKIDSVIKKMGKESIIPNPVWIKVYRNTTESSIGTTTESVNTTTAFNGPYKWMRPKFTEGGDGTEMEPVPKDLVEITESHNYSIPSDWVKVPKNESLETTSLTP